MVERGCRVTTQCEAFLLVERQTEETASAQQVIAVDILRAIRAFARCAVIHIAHGERILHNAVRQVQPGIHRTKGIEIGVVRSCHTRPALLQIAVAHIYIERIAAVGLQYLVAEVVVRRIGTQRKFQLMIFNHIVRTFTQCGPHIAHREHRGKGHYRAMHRGVDHRGTLII